MDSVFEYIDANLEASFADLVEYCRLPSVSAQRRAIGETAQHTIGLLEREGFTTRLLAKPNGAQPVVYAEQAGRGDRTLLFYNHYDVQPPDPLDEWSSPPFEPAWRDDKLYGRGVSDDKGNVTSRLLALRALKAVDGALPCNVKFFIEGDEEIGSPEIEPLFEEHGPLFRADACIWEWGLVYWDGTPSLMLGAKGLLYVELSLKGANRDLHSSYATVVPNPAWRLAWALATIKGADERILVDGFYDDVRPPSADAEAALHVMPDDTASTLASLGLEGALLGLSGVDYRRRHIFEPSCSIDGLTAGYQGPGSKTVLPARASAKIDFRLVPDQDPLDLAAKLRRHLDDHGFADVELKVYGAERAARTDMGDPFVALCAETARLAYGREPYLVPNMAATGPMYHFVHDLGLPTVMTGVNYVGGHDHAPDEHLRRDDYRRGTYHVAAILKRFGEA
jgi:acetylornithine deacetylase/succinyl-diaminopimelate desuccinylase-like protein